MSDWTELVEEGDKMGGWPAVITARLTGRATAAIDPVIGCLTAPVRLPNLLTEAVFHFVCERLCLCVCVYLSVCLCVSECVCIRCGLSPGHDS